MNENFTNHSFNFTDNLKAKVDPMTGQFLINMTIASLIANHNLGPHLDISLNYSPLNFCHYGFGNKISLSGLTEFHLNSNLISLSNGESYKIIPGSLLIRNQKIKNFKLRYTNKTNKEEGYTIFWKDGKIEKLEEIGNNLFVTKKIISPLGRTLNLSFSWDGTQIRLQKIKDEQEILLKIEYSDSANFITVWPSSIDTYTIRTDIINKTLLNKISLLTKENSLTWLLNYSKIENGQTLITDIEYPTGMRESIHYSKAKGFKDLLESDIPQVPAVISHSLIVGGNQPEITTHYEYTAQNFLGYNSNFGNWNYNNKYNHHTLTDYTYGSKSTIYNNKEKVTITKTYNNYNLPISEEFQNGSHIILTKINYYSQFNTFINKQPKQFQFPKSKIEIHKNLNDKTRRKEITKTRFDNNGNLIYSKTPEGIITKIRWTNINEDNESLEKNNNFNTFMISKTITYPKVPETGYSIPVFKTEYSYAKLGNQEFIVLEEVKTKSDKVTISEEKITYSCEENSEFGRILEICTTLFDKEDNTKKYETKTFYEITITKDSFSQKVRNVSYDGLESYIIKNYSPYRNLLLLEEDSEGRKSAYTYDEQSRIVSRRINADSKYENKTTWKYEYLNNGALAITEFDHFKNALKTTYDSLGKILLKEALDYEETGNKRWYKVESTKYNALGEITSEKISDWFFSQGEEPKPLILKENYHYDKWGNRISSISNGNIKHINIIDPIKLTHYETIEAVKENKTYKSFSLSTDFNNSGLPLSQKMVNSKGMELSKRSFKYDSMGRIFEEKDPLGLITKYTYDIKGRLETQTLPDGTIVTRTYAQHLLENHITSISVKGTDYLGQEKEWTLGYQEFDGVGRITKSISGGRETLYNYEGTSNTPKSIKTPAGDIIEHTLIPELGNIISQIKTNDLIQTFEFDPIRGLPLKASENNGSVIKNTWNQKGQLKSESSFITDQGEKKRSYRYSLLNTLIESEDLKGEVTGYKRNDEGLITSVYNNDIEVNLEYDEFYRIKEKKSKCKNTDLEVTTKLFYNERNQETSRIVNNRKNLAFKVTQNWNKNNQLTKRKTTYSHGTQEEEFSYDNRSRLIIYQVKGNLLPKDSKNREYTSQVYTYDSLNNITSLKTSFSNGQFEYKNFTYDNPEDPCQLMKINTSDSKNQDSNIHLEYNDNGYLTLDEEGRHLSYDALGRLIQVNACDENERIYFYDALNRLLQKKSKNKEIQSFNYEGNELISSIKSYLDSEITYTSKFLKLNHEPISSSQEEGDSKYFHLFSSNQSKTPVFSIDNEQASSGPSYYYFDPYGNKKEKNNEVMPSFNGEFFDNVSQTYHLGNGYRSYSPTLMRFTSPDNLSPFSFGGINCYTYCLGDPINNVDPSGHLSWQAWTGIALGTFGLALAAFTGGASIAAAGNIMGAISAASTTSLVIGSLAVASDVTAILSGSLEEAAPEASSTLGWISLATGIAGLAGTVGVGSKVLAKKGFSHFLPPISKSTALELKLASVKYGRDYNYIINPKYIEGNWEFSVFTDITRGKMGTRLNIMSHGVKGRNGIAKMQAVIEGNERVLFEPTDLYNYLRSQYVNMENYDRIRLIMCNSATGGAESFAGQLSKLVEKPVKGYKGTVKALTINSIRNHYIRRAERNGSLYREQDTIPAALFEYLNKGKVEIIKPTESFWSKITTNYKPRWFYPDGTITKKNYSFHFF